MTLVIACIILAQLCIVLGSWLDSRAKRCDARAQELQRRLDQFIADRAESEYCCRSLVYRLGPEARCECSRCRRERDELVSDATQSLAEQVQLAAMNADLTIIEGKS